MSTVTPSVDLVDFSCPYCQAHAAQTWYSLFTREIGGESRKPYLPSSPSELHEPHGSITQEMIDQFDAYEKRILAKEIFFDGDHNSRWVMELHNVNISHCFSCKKNALWHNRELVYPRMRVGAEPNPDLDQDIREDIDEARAILDISPRGAAALLRLAVQKLCMQLGEPGKKIDDDIQSLVDKGMDPHLQQAFDTVRVIGNEAVHPGELDLRDDRETALILIDLINIAAHDMISKKKAIAAVYQKLPASKLKGIDDRAKGAARKAQGAMGK
jgi:hypothetical protein